MPDAWLLSLCLLLIGLLGGWVVVLWFQLWLSRRDANLMRQISFVTPAVEPSPSGGCLGSLLLPALLLLVGLYLLAANGS
jgi:hypothetical protein